MIASFAGHPTQVYTPSFNPSQTVWYLIYLPRKTKLTSVVGYVPRWITCLQTITCWNFNGAWSRATSLMETIALTITFDCHSIHS